MKREGLLPGIFYREYRGESIGWKEDSGFLEEKLLGPVSEGKLCGCPPALHCLQGYRFFFFIQQGESKNGEEAELIELGFIPEARGREPEGEGRSVKNPLPSPYIPLILPPQEI